MKEIKPVDTEKRHLVNQYQSFLVTTFYKFWTVKILMQRSKRKKFQKEYPLREAKPSIEMWLEQVRPDRED